MNIFCGDALEQLKSLPSRSVRTCVTSPPYYGLRDYGHNGQIGLEQTPEQYIQRLVEVFHEVQRVLANDGTLWINIADSYNAAGRKGHGETITGKQATNRASAAKQDQDRPNAPGLKPKGLIGIPWMLAFALRADGWYLRQDIIWQKPNAMPESVTDRCTKSHEYLFLLSKSQKYYFDHKAIQEPTVTRDTTKRNRAEGRLNATPGRRRVDGLTSNNYEFRNKRDVWSINTKPFKGAHFATFPPELVEPCVLAGSAEDDTVLDPFAGSGTTGLVAIEHGRDFLGIELNPEYREIAMRRVLGTHLEKLLG